MASCSSSRLSSSPDSHYIPWDLTESSSPQDLLSSSPDSIGSGWIVLEKGELRLPFDPKDPQIKPTPSPMAILNVAGPKREGELSEWEIATRLQAEESAKKARAVSLNVLADDELAKISYLISHRTLECDCSAVEELINYQITCPPCSFADRVGFYRLSPNAQECVRTHYHEYLKELAQDSNVGGYVLTFSMESHWFDTLLFANSERFRDIIRNSLGVEREKRFNRAQTPAPEENNDLQTKVAIEMALEKDTRVLGGRWTGLQIYTELAGADHLSLEPCTLGMREFFYSLPPFHQNAIRTKLFDCKGKHTKEVLKNSAITTPDQLSRVTDGKYTSFESLVTNDMLFSDAAAFQRIAHALGIDSTFQ